jgi:hypothetical protein
MVIIWLMMVNNIWLVVEPYPSEKYDFVSWDDKIRNRWNNKIHDPNHQPVPYYPLVQVYESTMSTDPRISFSR